MDQKYIKHWSLKVPLFFRRGTQEMTSVLAASLSVIRVKSHKISQKNAASDYE
jgi:hypothetical protein